MGETQSQAPGVPASPNGSGGRTPQAAAPAAPEALPEEAGLPPPLRPAAELAEPGAVPLGQPLQPGLIIQKTLRLDARIAQDDIAEIWRGLNTASGTPVVFKFVRRELFADEKFLQRFRAEAEALTRVQDPAVACCFGCYQDEAGRLFLLSEYINGMSLAERMKFGPMPPNQVMNLRDRLVRGLAAAHEQGVVHRGLSPDTIILADGRLDQAKIIDFGVGKEFARPAESASAPKPEKKSLYLAPEQLGLFGGKVDERTDIYSLGLILAAAAGGTPVEAAGLPPATLFERRKEVPRIDDVPAELRGGLTAMLQPDPALRPRAMVELLAPPRPGPVKAPVPLPPPAAPPRATRAVRTARAGSARLHRPYAAVGAGVLALLVAGGIVVAYRAQIFGGAARDVAAGPAPGAEAQSAAALSEQPVPAISPTKAAAEPAESSAKSAPAALAAKPATTALAATAALEPEQPAPAPEEVKPQPPPAAAAPAPAPEEKKAQPPPAAAAPAPAPEEAKSQPPPAAVAPAPAAPNLPPAAAVAAPQPLPPPVASAPAAEPAPPSPTPPASEAQAKPAPEVVANVQPPLTQPSLRERVQSVLQPMECKSLRAAVSGNGIVDIDGFVSSPSDLDALPVRLAALGGVSKVNLHVSVRKWPFCAVLALLQDEAVTPGAVKGPLRIVPNHGSAVYRDGDSLEFTVNAAGAANGYLYVAVIDPEGNVLHLFPTDDKQDNRISAGMRHKFGSILPDGKPELLISPPAGDLLIVALLSPERLFAALRPGVEPVGDFLAALKPAAEALRRARPGASIIAETVTLQTLE
ncbi:MAG TPA: serine/threonine-protein kinase [Alphaproteobacteria bacterium]|nr:serine/threonine-protein kinase [Alphaproteobacteria bacterium]